MKLNLKPRQVDVLDKEGNPTGVTAIVKPLQTWASLEFQNALADGKFKIDKDSMELLRKILKGHVESISGFTVDDHAGTLDELLDNAATVSYALNLLSALIKTSSLTETEAGN